MDSEHGEACNNLSECHPRMAGDVVTKMRSFDIGWGGTWGGIWGGPGELAVSDLGKSGWGWGGWVGWGEQYSGWFFSETKKYGRWFLKEIWQSIKQIRSVSIRFLLVIFFININKIYSLLFLCEYFIKRTFAVRYPSRTHNQREWKHLFLIFYPFVCSYIIFVFVNIFCVFVNIFCVFVNILQ